MKILYDLTFPIQPLLIMSLTLYVGQSINNLLLPLILKNDYWLLYSNTPGSAAVRGKSLRVTSSVVTRWPSVFVHVFIVSMVNIVYIIICK